MEIPLSRLILYIRPWAKQSIAKKSVIEFFENSMTD